MVCIGNSYNATTLLASVLCASDKTGLFFILSPLNLVWSGSYILLLMLWLLLLMLRSSDAVAALYDDDHHHLMYEPINRQIDRESEKERERKIVVVNANIQSAERWLVGGEGVGQRIAGQQICILI